MDTSNYRRQFIFHVLVIILLSASVVWIRTATVRETYRFVQAEKRLQATKQAIQTLRVKWTKLTAPRKLMVAAKEFNLEPPKLEQIVKHSLLRPKL